MGSSQRTRSQRWYEHSGDLDKTVASKLDALDAVFKFVKLVYHKKWSEDEAYDASYDAPTREDLKTALLQMEARVVLESA